MSGGRENKARTAEIEAAKARTKASVVEFPPGMPNASIDSVVATINAAFAERDASQTALGLASEEVRELRAEVAALKESRDEWQRRAFDRRAEVARLTEALRGIEAAGSPPDDDRRWPAEMVRSYQAIARAALSPASTELPEMGQPEAYPGWWRRRRAALCGEGERDA